MHRSLKEGYTLLELVTVISILRILAVMAVQKFFNLLFKAPIEPERQLLGTTRARLATNTARRNVFTVRNIHPVSTITTLLVDILSIVPPDWSYSTETPGTITHSKRNSEISWTYTRSTNDAYSIDTRTSI